jgi:hypothetical protein
LRHVFHARGAEAEEFVKSFLPDAVRTKILRRKIGRVKLRQRNLRAIFALAIDRSASTLKIHAAVGHNSSGRMIRRQEYSIVRAAAPAAWAGLPAAGEFLAGTIGADPARRGCLRK